MRTVLPAICFLLVVFVAYSFPGKPGLRQKIVKKQVSIFFHHFIGKEDLVLGNPVKNILGEQVVIDKFKYYISNFSVKDAQGNTTLLPVSYFLVDEADSSSKTISLTIPDITISSIRFLLGVDSIRNVSGVQTGALDPMKGMFWTWNSGYIMAKLEGSSEQANSAGHRFTYHIGGFRAEQNTSKWIDLDVSKKEGNPIKEIHVKADINCWFKGKSDLKIAESPVCHSPGNLAIRIADNYSNMFSIYSLR